MAAFKNGTVLGGDPSSSFFCGDLLEMWKDKKKSASVRGKELNIRIPNLFSPGNNHVSSWKMKSGKEDDLL